MHKRVCGIRANPFQWPPFEQEEMDEMISLSKKPFKVGADGAISTLAGTLCQNLKHNFEEETCDVVFAVGDSRVASDKGAITNETFRCYRLSSNRLKTLDPVKLSPMVRQSSSLS